MTRTANAGQTMARCAEIARRLVVVLALPWSSLTAQHAPLDHLQPIDGKLKSDFANVPTVREIGDGRLLIPDGQRLVLADFSTGAATPVLRIVHGTVFALPGDSTLVISEALGWLLVAGSAPVGTIPPSNPVVLAARQVYGADATGHVLTIVGGWPASDSAIVRLINRDTGEPEYVTRVYQGPHATGGVPAPSYVVEERPVLGLDGWIAVIRVNPYRVDWRTPTGVWMLGAPLPIPPVKMDEREKSALITREYRGRMVLSPNAAGNWPQWVPPVSRSLATPMMSPEGNAVIPRTPTADHPNAWYDVVNRRGELVREFELGARDWIAGFGPHAVYVAVPSGGPDVHIERRPWP